MVKKIFKMALSLVMILGIIIAISNVSSLDTGALTGEWEKLHEIDAGNGNTIYWCNGDGEDCMIVRPPKD